MERTHKYEVHVNTIIFNESGTSNESENFKYEFKDGTLAEMRKEAIDKYNDLSKFFEDEMPKGNEFHSPAEVKKNGFSNAKIHSIGVYFFINDFDYQIIGDDEIAEESEEVERGEFERMNISYSN